MGQLIEFHKARVAPMSEEKDFYAKISWIIATITGVSAVAFSGINYLASERNYSATQVKAELDWNLTGLKMYYELEDKLVTCEADYREKHLRLIYDLFPKLRQNISDAA